MLKKSTYFPPEHAALARTGAEPDDSKHIDACGFVFRAHRRRAAMALHRPGDFVSRSGIYFALHSEHRVIHELTLTKGELFPQCRICGARVSFQLWRAKAVVAAAVLPSILVPYCYSVISTFEGLSV